MKRLANISFLIATYFCADFLFGAVESTLKQPRFSFQTMAVQQERFSGRALVGVAPWPDLNRWYGGVQLLLGAGVINDDHAAQEKKVGYEFITGSQVRIRLSEAFALRSSVQSVATKESQGYDTLKLFPALSIGYLL